MFKNNQAFCPGTWIAFRQDVCEDVTPGGIIIPDSKKDSHAPFRGYVVLAGLDCEYVRDGDTIRFDRTGAFTEDIKDEETGKKVTIGFIKEEYVILVEGRSCEKGQDNDPEEEYPVVADSGVSPY